VKTKKKYTDYLRINLINQSCFNQLTDPYNDLQ